MIVISDYSVFHRVPSLFRVSPVTKEEVSLALSFPMEGGGTWVLKGACWASRSGREANGHIPASQSGYNICEEEASTLIKAGGSR